MIKRSKKATSRHHMIKALDAAARQIVFERDGHRCVRCNSPDRDVQWAHILSRRHLCTRWNPDNALALCAGCHMFWHNEPALSVPWFIGLYRERWESITAILRVNPKVIVKFKYQELLAENKSS